MIYQRKRAGEAPRIQFGDKIRDHALGRFIQRSGVLPTDKAIRNSCRSASALWARSTIKLAASATKFFVRITSPAMRLDRAVRLAAFFQIALVIFFRPPELQRRLDLGHDRSIKF